MEKVPGANCWETLDAGLEEGEVSEDHTRAMVKGWAELSISLAGTTYKAMGCPDLDDAGNIVIGNMLGPSYPDMPNYPYFAGPFKAQRERWLNKLDCLLNHAKMGWLVNDQPLVVYLALLHTRALVETNESFAKQETEFYVKHPDSHGGNIMAEGSRITALIDWER